MFKKIAGFFKWIGGLFKGAPKPIEPDGPTVVSTWLERDDDGGKIIKVTKYSDGKIKREPYDASDPSGIDDFLDDVT